MNLLHILKILQLHHCFVDCKNIIFLQMLMKILLKLFIILNLCPPIIKNVQRFHKWRQHLLLLLISERSISISSKKTPLTSKNSKMAYQLSISNIIWHVLNNPSLMRHMYFGSGIDSETKSEYWHGELWEESPFYGQEKITILQG